MTVTVNSAARVTVTVITALLCMPHATAYVAGPGDANEPSQYASSDTLRRRTQRPGGDLSEPAVLQAAVQDRTFRGEIILFAFNFCSISDALALRPLTSTASGSDTDAAVALGMLLSRVDASPPRRVYSSPRDALAR